MPNFAGGIPRLAVLLFAVGTFSLIAPETLARGPSLCLWRHLFYPSACPACGTLRALTAFFHGSLGEALAFNRNVLITAPTLVGLVAVDTLHLLRKYLSS